jgi:hypothetical protein
MCYSRTVISCHTVNLQASPSNCSVKYTHNVLFVLQQFNSLSEAPVGHVVALRCKPERRGFESLRCRSSRTMALGLTQPLTDIVVSRWIRRQMQGRWFSAAVLVYWLSSWSEDNGPSSDIILPAAGTAATPRNWFIFGLLKYPLYNSLYKNRSHADRNFLYFSHSSYEIEHRHSQVVGRPRC